jgi:hypothetical protein
LPFCITPAKCWTINSWDRFQIPQPFTRALVTIAPPLFVAPAAGEEIVNAAQAELQAALDAMVKRGEEWRAGLN